MIQIWFDCRCYGRIGYGIGRCSPEVPHDWEDSTIGVALRYSQCARYIVSLRAGFMNETARLLEI